MKRFVITVPEEAPIDTSTILDLIELGASRHAVFTRQVDEGIEIHHQRLNATIVEIHGVSR